MDLWGLLFGRARDAAPPASSIDDRRGAIAPDRAEGHAARDAAAAPPVSPAGLALIKRFEGLRLAPYRDAASHLTIGYGHLIRPGERFGAGFGEADATALLSADLHVAESAVARLATVPLTSGQRDALISFVFNLGAARLAGSTLLKKLNAGDPLGAAAEFVRWIHAGGRPLKGLLRRRLAEATLFLED
jgi:lysozyme